jgi:hypothetical protein
VSAAFTRSFAVLRASSDGEEEGEQAIIPSMAEVAVKGKPVVLKAWGDGGKGPWREKLESEQFGADEIRQGISKAIVDITCQEWNTGADADGEDDNADDGDCGGDGDRDFDAEAEEEECVAREVEERKVAEVTDGLTSEFESGAKVKAATALRDRRKLLHRHERQIETTRKLVVEMIGQTLFTELLEKAKPLVEQGLSLEEADTLQALLESFLPVETRHCARHVIHVASAESLVRREWQVLCNDESREQHHDVREPPPPLKGGPPLLAGTHIDTPAHTQTCRHTHKPL